MRKLFGIPFQLPKKFQLQIENNIFDAQITYKKRLKNINFRISEKNIIKISCRPRTPQKHLEEILLKHSQWLIESNLKIINRSQRQQEKYQEGQLHPFQGKKFPLLIDYHHLKRSKLDFHQTHFKAILCYDLSTRQQRTMLESLFKKFYFSHTRQYVEAKLKELHTISPQKINSVSYKNLKTRWGSCSAQKNLNFNLRLATLPPEQQLYIIVHEFCHLFELNHSPRFWNKVASFLPDYKNLRKSLKYLEKSMFLE